MRIQTYRLNIIQLSLERWEDFFYRRDQVELSMGLEPTPRLMDLESETEYLKLLPGLLKRAVKDAKNLAWYTLWLLIHHKDQTAIGGIFFAGPPTKDGGLCIGFYLAEPYRGRGLMAEAIKGVIAWSFAQPNVQYIVAQTERIEISSMRVLEKAGFVRQNQGDQNIIWLRTKE